MRHNKKANNLSRTSAHRKAMMANMATSLIMHKRINTTVAKAKALRIYVEPVITKAKEDSTHARREAFRYLRDKHAVTELFRVVSPAVGDRPGGYTRILKTGFRLGDAADMCFIELVDFNETYSQEAAATAKPRTRRGRGAGTGVAQKAEGTTAKEGEVITEAKETVAKTEKKATAAKKPATKKTMPKAESKRTAASKSTGAKKTATRSTSTKKG